MKLRLLDIVFAALLALLLVRGTAYDPFKAVSDASDCRVIGQPVPAAVDAIAVCQHRTVQEDL